MELLNEILVENVDNPWTKGVGVVSVTPNPGPYQDIGSPLPLNKFIYSVVCVCFVCVSICLCVCEGVYFCG